MTKRIIISALIILAFIGFNSIHSQDMNFNGSWLFYNDEAPGAEQAGFDDSGWRKLDLPHDWAIEGPFDPKYNPRCGGLPFHGTGWYRKHFKLPEGSEGKVVRIEFEGAMANAHVWVNGTHVGERPYGYIGFEFDISKYLKYNGSENVIAVRLTPEDLSSRWYPGAGIYRSVWLKIDNPVHVAHWGTFISTPGVSENRATIQVETTVINRSSTEVSVKLQHEYFSPEGKSVGTVEDILVISPGSNVVSEVYSHIDNPMRWDTRSPNLYSAVTTISKNGEKTDTYKTRFGIRSIDYDVNGFYLNGRKVRFNGVCLHHDNGALGAAVYRRADERKLQILKEMGVNAVRTSHNPPSRVFLELCDELGIMVLDEAFDVWKIAKVPNGYNKYFDDWAERDLKDMIRRDRNHPSVIMWSIGNEIKEQADKKNGWKVARMLNDYCKELDVTRPTTVGLNNYPGPYDFNFAEQVDIAGINYKPSKYSEIRAKLPNLPIYGSENSSCTSSRGVYHLPIEKYKTHESLHVTSYDLIGPPWAYPPDVEFHFQKENPYVMGEFIWTGFDYLGEPTPYGGRDHATDGLWNADWPSRSSYFGAVDLCGFPKDRFYLYQSQWTRKPMLHILPHWNWEGKEGEEIPVYCYTNCMVAELFVNGKSMGLRIKGENPTEILVDFLRYEPKTFQSAYRLSWNVPYEPGTIKVVGYYGHASEILETQVNTAGKPAKVSLSVDRNIIDADGRDLAYVTVRIEDKDGNLCPMADNLVTFSTKGTGELIAVGNGNQATTEPFQADYRKAFNGMALAILRSTNDSGEIRLTAKSKGLKSDVVIVNTKK